MKAFWIALVIFILVLFGIGWNTFLIRRATSELLLQMENLLESEEIFLTQENQNEIDVCFAIFDKNSLLFQLSFPQEKVDETEKHLQELKMLSKSGSFSDYLIAKEAFEKSVMDLKEMAGFSLENIF